MPRSTHLPSNIHHLLLATVDKTHGAHSGYTAISQHLPDSQLIQAARSEPTAFLPRAFTRLLTRFTATRWCRPASVAVEWQAWQLIRSGFKGIVHTLWGDRDWAFLDYAIKRSGPKMCVTFHSCPDTLPEILRSSRRLRHLHAIILMSEVQRPFFESCGVSPERIHVIPHGVDCDFFRPANPATRRPFTVLSVGNYRRNFPLLHDVCERLMQDSDIQVKIVAHPSQRPVFADLSNVDFQSNIQDEQLLALYQNASCMLMTLDAATANNAILEALACGLPIVSEDVGGIREYTGDDAARLHPPGDAESLANSVMDLRKNSSLRESMSAAARTRAMELDWSIVAQNTAAVYQKLVTQVKPPR